MNQWQSQMAVRAVISVLVTALGVMAMVLTDGETGCGWAVLGLVVIWS